MRSQDTESKVIANPAVQGTRQVKLPEAVIDNIPKTHQPVMEFICIMSAITVIMKIVMGTKVTGITAIGI